VELALSLLGTGLGATAMVFAFLTARQCKKIYLSPDTIPLAQLKKHHHRILISLVAGTSAGMIQAGKGDLAIMLVWISFVVIQCLNLNIVYSALRKASARRNGGNNHSYGRK